MSESSFNIDISGLKEFSVSEISNKVKELLENNLNYVRIKGEISGLKIATSGHSYFNLKDNFAIIACTCWRPALAKIKFPLSDGMEIAAEGKITAYGGQSRYQLSVEKIEAAGRGAMMQLLQERRAKLAKEGLFDKSRKKSLPFFPNRIGVVTSITGAVIRDIIHRISDRWPLNILIWPVTVQGERAAEEIAGAVNGFNNLKGEAKPDVIIVARGGGSIEDLWPFNEEVVVRAVANSMIPVISAVGHETDYTLIDLVADVRAPTPTAAAEFASPVAYNLGCLLISQYNRILTRTNELLKFKQQALASCERILKYPVNYLNIQQQKLDESGFRLTDSLPNSIRYKAASLDRFSKEQLNPAKIINYKYLQLSHSGNYLIKLADKILQNFEHKMHLNSILLTSLDYHQVLKRGFTLIKDEAGVVLTTKSDADLSASLTIRFSDGDLKVKKL